MSTSILLNAMAYATAFCFPLLMVATVIIFLARKRGEAFLESNPGARRAYDRIVAAGPKEGWSGYVIGAIVFLWLAVMAALILLSMQGLGSTVEIEGMMRVELDGGGYGYVSLEEMDDATLKLVQSGDVPGEAHIPAYSEDGEIVGEYTVVVEG